MMSNNPSRDQASQERKQELLKLKKEFASVKFRWVLAVFFIVSIGMVIYLLISGDQPEVILVHPIHFKGNGLLWASLGVSVFWGE
jgi:hypothetical protein